jgi:hypothetical protein
MPKRKPGPKRAVKATTRKRSLNAVPVKKPPRGAPASDQDVERRLGNFSTAGEPARSGVARKTGQVNSPKRRAQTNKRK